MATVVLAVLVIFFVCCIPLLSVGRRPKDLPPGPPTLPIIGNIHQMPSRDAHLQFEAWAREYGPVYSLIFGTKTMIVLNSHEAVRDLLDRRSAIYSDRLSAYLLATIASNDMRLLTMHYGPRWRMIRKVLHSMLNVSAAKRYVPYQSLESKQMLQEILDRPEDVLDSLQRYSNSLTTQMTFGWRTINNQDPKLKLLFESLDRFEHMSQTGFAAMVDFFPILQYLPGPLMPLKAFATKVYEDQKGLYIEHWLNVKNAIKAGTSVPCLSVDLARLQDEEGFSDEQAAFIAGTSLEAGSETTSATLYAFVQAMVLFPEVQKKAQAQIEAVCGDRLPEMEDSEKLPYIRCVMKETFRWLPAAVLGVVPHAVTQDDYYMGYLIPKGAGVINNAYAISSDPDRYPDPRQFNPERYKNDHNTIAETATSSDINVRDHFTFGAGRRICQGMHVAERSLFLAMSRLLWAFDFRAVPGKTPDPSKLSQGILATPEKFDADIMPRMGRGEQIRGIWDEAQGVLNGEGQWVKLPDELKA